MNYPFKGVKYLLIVNWKISAASRVFECVCLFTLLTLTWPNTMATETISKQLLSIPRYNPTLTRNNRDKRALSPQAALTPQRDVTQAFDRDVNSSNAVWSGGSTTRSKTQRDTPPQQSLHHYLSQRETYIVKLLVGALQRLLCFLGFWQMLHITEKERESGTTVSVLWAFRNKMNTSRFFFFFLERYEWCLPQHEV